MKRYLIALLIMAAMVSANATKPLAEPRSREVNSLRAQELMDGLTRTIAPAPANSSTIGEIEALGLKPTAANVGAVQQMLARKNDSATKISLIYLLGSLFTRNDQSGQNAMIARTLKSHVSGGDPAVGTAALLSYSRTGYQPDGVDMLDYGLKHNLVSARTYSRELALGLLYAPATEQMAAASRLAEKDNPFGAEVLALSISNQTSIASINPDVRAVLLAFLGKHEPIMPRAIGEFGVTDGIRYCYWLTAMARLLAADGKGSSTSYILNKLSSPETDPRKILSYLSSPEGARFMNTVGSRAALAQATDRALLPTRQFPGHPIFTPMGEELTKAITQLKN